MRDRDLDQSFWGELPEAAELVVSRTTDRGHGWLILIEEVVSRRGLSMVVAVAGAPALPPVRPSHCPKPATCHTRPCLMGFGPWLLLIALLHLGTAARRGAATRTETIQRPVAMDKTPQRQRGGAAGLRSTPLGPAARGGSCGEVT